MRSLFVDLLNLIGAVILFVVVLVRKAYPGGKG